MDITKYDPANMPEGTPGCPRCAHRKERMEKYATE